MDIFEIIALGIIGAILSVTLKAYRPEYAILSALGTGIVIILLTSRNLFSIIDSLRSIITKTGIDSRYFKIILKVIGISYITQFGVELCKDSGYNSIALKVDMAGKICVLTLTVPVISEFLNIIIKILNTL